MMIRCACRKQVKNKSKFCPQRNLEMLAVLGPDTNPMLTLAMVQCEEGESGTMASVEERREKAPL